MNNIQIAVAKALGWKYEQGQGTSTEGESRSFGWWIDPDGERHGSLALPDPSDPRVYEKVVALAIEKDGKAYRKQLKHESGAIFSSSYGRQDEILATAPWERRLTVALRVLGEIEE